MQKSVFPHARLVALAAIVVFALAAGGTASATKPSGDFSAAATSPEAAGSSPRSVAVGDFNRDGNADLALANFNSNDVSILLGG